MNENSPLIQIKGIRDGLLITLGEAAWPDLHTAFIQYIDEQPSFFQGGRIALDVGKQALRVAELSALRDQLSERGIALWAVLSESTKTERTAQNLGMATRISKPRSEVTEEVPETAVQDSALWVRHTVRSGVHIESAGHLAVMGDVNPGAELVACGSIVVWGRLRGVVHAGSQGDEQAIVCALELAPTQLRIADKITLSPKREGDIQPEVACLQDGHLVVKPWQDYT